MKKYLEKILIIFLIFLIVFNFTISSFVHTVNAQPEEENYETNLETEDDIPDTVIKYRDSLNPILLLMQGVGIIVDLFLFLPRLIGLTAGWTIQGLLAGVLSMGGTLNDESYFATPYEIIFDKYKITDINFFNLTDPDIQDETKIGIKVFRQNVSLFYYIMRLIAIAILAIVLVYIGIRMALSTIASEKATYKKMLADWATSLALVFLLHYIMIAVININSIIIQVLADVADDIKLENFMTSAFIRSLGLGITPTISTLIFTMLIMQTLMFLITYMKRMLTVGFLIVISPLITITYSMDRIGDGKAQALNTWMKEFAYNILIQPFHCLLYLAIVGTSVGLLKDSVFEFSTMGEAVFALVCMKFIKDGEKIIKKIFGFEKAGSVGSVAASAAIAMSALKNSKQIASGIATAGIGMQTKLGGLGDKFNKFNKNEKVQSIKGNLKESKLGQAISEGKEKLNDSGVMKGLKDTTKDLKDTAKNLTDSEAFQGFKDYASKSVSTGLGILAGGMALQSGGIMEAATVGTIAKSATNEYMSRTKGTLKKNIRRNLDSTNNNEETDEARLKRIKSMGDRKQFKDVKKQLEGVMESILKAKGVSDGGQKANLIMYQLSRTQQTRTDERKPTKTDYNELLEATFGDTTKINNSNYSDFNDDRKHAFLNESVSYETKDKDGNKQTREGNLRDVIAQYETLLADMDIYKDMKIMEAGGLKVGDFIAREQYRNEPDIINKNQDEKMISMIPDSIPEDQKELLNNIKNDGQLADKQLKNIITNLENNNIDTDSLEELVNLLNSTMEPEGNSGDIEGSEPMSTATSEATKKVINTGNITREKISFLQEIDRVERSRGTESISARYINNDNISEKLSIIQSVIQGCMNKGRSTRGTGYTNVISQLESTREELENLR